MSKRDGGPDVQVATAIFDRYRRYYKGEVQGCCILIADEIQRAIGGEVVAGEICLYQAPHGRTHWWVEKDGQRIDPMGDDWTHPDDYPVWREAHRSRDEFEAILPTYEHWRVTPAMLSQREADNASE